MNPQGGGENSYSDREFRSTQPARKKIHTIATQTRKRQIHGVNFFIPDDRETQKPLSRARQADRIRLRRERTALVQPTQASFCRKIWRRGWDSDSLHPLIPRKLLNLRPLRTLQSPRMPQSGTDSVQAMATP